MKKVSKNKMLFIVTSICLVGLVCVGISYAYWRISLNQQNPNIGITDCLDLKIQDESNEINLTNMYPLSDEEGRKLTPYTFKIKNTCSLAADYTLNMEMLEGTTLNSKFIAVVVNNGAKGLLSNYKSTDKIINSSTEARVLDTGTISPNATKEYAISLWMDESVTLNDDVQNKSFKSKIWIDAVVNEDDPLDRIISQLDTTGKCPTVSDDGSVDVSSIEDVDGYLCQASDNYGTSYYYRGNVVNNYVYFANAYWRIIRINGDNSIRVIYDGPEAYANNEANSNRKINSSYFNEYWKNNDETLSSKSQMSYDNAYLGYMYGNYGGIVESSTANDFARYNTGEVYYVSKEYTYDSNTNKFALKNPVSVVGGNIADSFVGYYTLNSNNYSASSQVIYKIKSITNRTGDSLINYTLVTYGTTSKENAQTNTNSSDAKNAVDTWYENNIKNTENEQYMVDNLFCNDRTIISGAGYGSEKTIYRWSSSKHKISLICPQKNDAFTVSDGINGNEKLKYPIGLITADEVALAGGLTTNKNYFLYTGSGYWTMTPYIYNYPESFDLNLVTSNGGLGLSYLGSIRPVINLKLDVLSEGSGTADDPYHVS